jgi:hypothetical protein
MRRHPPQEQPVQQSVQRMRRRKRASGSEPDIVKQSCPLISQGVDPAVNQWNKNSINVLLGHFVISAGTKVEDLKRLIEQTPLHVIYVVIDVHGDRRKMMLDLFTAKHGEGHRSRVWGSMELPGWCNGYMLFKQSVVTCVEQVSTITSHSDSCTQVAHRVTLAPGPKNPPGHLRVACLFRFAQETDAVACGETSRTDAVACGETSQWTPAFLQAMISQVLNDQVRILVGVFAVAEQQVTKFAQESGATGTQPFLQLFFDHNRGEHMLFTVYGFVFGPCAGIRHAEKQDSPWLFRAKQGLPNLSVPLISCSDHPQWSHIQRSGAGSSNDQRSGAGSSNDQRRGAGSSNDQRSGAADRMLELHSCVTKPANMKKWIHGVHQLLLFIGKQRRGKKSALNHDKKRATQRDRGPPQSRRGT